jgi:O-antigen ligase
METRESALRTPGATTPGWWGVGLAAAGLAAALVWLDSSFFGLLLLGGLAGTMAFLAAFRWPMLLVAAYWMVAPFNYGQMIGGGVFKISEAVIGLMLTTVLLRLAIGDPAAWRRVRRGAPVLATLGLLAVLAMATAAPHPNFFNVRYEIQNYIAMAYGLIFFRRRHWPLLAASFAGALAIESILALLLKYGMGLTGVSFFGVGGGIEPVQLTAEDLASRAGGLFRLSGTFGHKNLLAAFFVLLLPLATLELLRRPLGWLLAVVVLGPALVALGLTDSMTGWGATVLMIVVALAHLRRFDYLAVFCLLLLPVGALALYKFGGSIFFRVEQLSGGGGAGLGTVHSRMETLEISRRLIAQHPWFGIGRNNFADYGATYFSHAHNLFLMKLIEMGVPAGLMFATFILAVLARTWKTLLAETGRLSRQGQYYRFLGVWLGCLGYTAMNQFDYNYTNFSLGPMYMLMLGILLAVAWDAEIPERSSSAKRAGG